MLFINHQNVLSITRYFIVVNDVFTKDQCQQVVDIGKKSDISPSKILSHDNEHSCDVHPSPTDIRKSKSSFILPNEENAWIFQRLLEVSNFANENYFHFDLHGFNFLQYTEYHQGGDHYDWHMDLALKGSEIEDPLPDARNRKLSASVFISDPSEYTGGQLYIDRYSNNAPIYTINQQIGSVVFFPSYLHHKVDKVYSGIRRSLVFWLQGPKFK